MKCLSNYIFLLLATTSLMVTSCGHETQETLPFVETEQQKIPTAVNSQAWSPDSRYVAFSRSMSGLDNPLYVYDTRLKQNTTFNELSASYGGIPQFIGAKKVVYTATLNAPRDLSNGSIINLETNETIAIKGYLDHDNYCVSPDGKYIYAFMQYIHDPSNPREPKIPHYIVKISTENPEEHEVLMEANIYMIDLLSLSPDGKRLMFLKRFSGYEYTGRDVKLVILDLESREFNTILLNVDIEFSLNSAVWIDDNRIAYVTRPPTKTWGWWNTMGILYMHNLVTGEKTKWAESIYPYSLPALSPDGKSLWVSYYDESQTSYQLARIDIETSKLTVETESPFPIDRGFESPDGKTLAYWVQCYYGFKALFLRDLVTGQEEIAWVSAGMEPLKQAYAYQQAGENHKAIEAYQALVSSLNEKTDGYSKRNSDYCLMALIRLCLKTTPPETDLAFDLLPKYSYPYIPYELFGDFWKAEHLLEIFPQETTTENAESMRDVYKVWLRTGEKNLYVNIEYAGSEGRYLTSFKNVVLLFDYDSPKKGNQTILPGTQWEHGAEMAIHFTQDHNYEIINENGEIISKGNVLQKDGAIQLVDGYSHPDTTRFPSACPPPAADMGGGLVYSISRESLGLEPGQKFQLKLRTRPNLAGPSIVATNNPYL